jgi:hypothetical protein
VNKAPIHAKLRTWNDKTRLIGSTENVIKTSNLFWTVPLILFSYSALFETKTHREINKKFPPSRLARKAKNSLHMHEVMENSSTLRWNWNLDHPEVTIRAWIYLFSMLIMLKVKLTLHILCNVLALFQIPIEFLHESPNTLEREYWLFPIFRWTFSLWWRLIRCQLIFYLHLWHSRHKFNFWILSKWQTSSL